MIWFDLIDCVTSLKRLNYPLSVHSVYLLHDFRNEYNLSQALPTSGKITAKAHLS